MEIIAHRGASYDAPENTVAAARLAWEQGADALECDVQLTRDGRLAVLHDEDTARVAEAKQVAAHVTLAELQTLDVGRWKDPSHAGERIPELAELITTVPPGKRIFIEVKGGPEAIAPLEQTLARSGRSDLRAVIISFNLAAATAAKRRMPQREVCWLCERELTSPSLDAIVSRAQEAGLDGLDLDEQFPIDAAFVSRVHAAGLKLYVWTVDDTDRGRFLRAAGVDGITTNRPDWLRRQLRKGAN